MRRKVLVALYRARTSRGDACSTIGQLALELRIVERALGLHARRPRDGRLAPASGEVLRDVIQGALRCRRARAVTATDADHALIVGALAGRIRA